jgi:hypothetical protein
MSAEQVRHVVKKTELFRLGVMIVDEHLFTALELMKHLAFVGGLLHAGGPKHPKDKAYQAYRSMLPIGGNVPGLLTLRAIGRVVHAGLMPLQDAVIRESIDNEGQDSITDTGA